jgi:glycosyltransferase involved in cell wall biosynthesis
MRVAVNALHLVPGETGGLEIYARRLLPELAREVELVVLASREGYESLAEFDPVRVPVNARNRYGRVLAEQFRVRGRVRGADLLHNLFNTAPALPGIPQVTTIHDLIYRHVPERTLLSRGQELLVPLAAHRSRRVIAVSEATRRDVVEILRYPAARVDVVPNGPGIAPVRESPDPDEVRRELDAGARPLVLTVSAKLPHKNAARLIEAVGRLRDLDPLLVIPGYATSNDAALAQAARDAGADVRFLGWIDETDLDGLYRAADVFAMPSLAEGFGFPVVEAMLRGTPVACSNATSLPEVAGDAALLFDPLSVEAIADALRRLLTDAALRERLVAAGRERAQLFSWRRSAEMTLQSYRRCFP